MKILRAIANGIWMIDRTTAEAYLPLAIRLLKGEPVKFDFEGLETKPRLTSLMSGAVYNADGEMQQSESEASLVAVYPVVGLITKFDQECGPDGTETLMRWMSRYEQDKRVMGHLLKIDSGGGEATNIESVARFIRSLSKPVVAWYNGAAASAAYYMAAAADEIYASEDTDEVGSIGALISFTDVRGYWEQQGVQFHEIYADQSDLKNLDFKEALKGKYDPLREQVVNPYAQRFIDTVKEFRPGMTDKEAYRGKLYMSAKALEIGMIDGVKTYEEALVRVGDMAAERKNSNYNNLNMKSYANLTAVLGDFETKDGGVFLNEEQLSLLNARVLADENAEQDLNTLIAQANATATELQKLAAETRRSTEVLRADMEKMAADLADTRTQLAATEERLNNFGKKQSGTRMMAYSDSDKPLTSDDDDDDDLLKFEREMASAATTSTQVIFD
jgi:protease-4